MRHPIAYLVHVEILQKEFENLSKEYEDRILFVCDGAVWHKSKRLKYLIA
ncbi:hypothetical protein HMPREF1987_01487 [Peptostreptococcaceae bacterium oral taxon 113 str. W5053]|nr:hypothetical protein HMPREF1987_01487 [Peptostreptococcaceae bacterium oral taxon 113 str. W5053]